MKRHKYRAKPTVVDNVRFDSKREAEVYVELLTLLRAGRIKTLQLQPAFPLQPAFVSAGKTIREIDYVADFMVVWDHGNGGRCAGDQTIIEVKGYKTPEYRLKLKLFLFKYPEWAGHFEEWK